MPTSRPRQRRDAEARPDEILDAALTEFAAAGFDAARMDDIAKRAGISKAGVYLYFASKEELLHALIDREVAPIADRLSALAAAGKADPAATLRLIALTAATQLLFNDRVFRVPQLMISVSNRFPELAEFYRTRVVDIAFKAAEGVIAAGAAQGVFRDVAPRAAVRAFIGPLLFEALYRHILRGDGGFTDPESFLDQHLGVLMHGIAAEPKP